MKAIYFDCFSGAAGDMIVGALVDLGVPAREVRAALASLELSGLKVSFRTVRRGALGARKFTVSPGRRRQPHRGLREIRRLLRKTDLSAGARRLADRAFTRLCEAEARVHRIPVARVHLHEVGAVDSIADVVAAAFCLDRLRPGRVVVSPLATGSGTVDCAHGTLPVPAPAVLELLRGVPAYPGPAACEMLTPTGAAFLTAAADRFGPRPRMRIGRTGLGAGDRDGPGLPNVLRVTEGELDAAGEETADVVVLEANVDDMSPQIAGHLMDRLLGEGALEVFHTPVQMKKSRPGLLLTVIARPEARGAMENLLFRETTTIGLRWRSAARRELAREKVRVRTRYGMVTMKIASLDGEPVQASPEYEDCRALARRRNVPLRRVQEEAVQAWRRRREEE